MKFQLAALALVFASTASLAADMLTGEQILVNIAGNTVQGSMVSSGKYSEFYAENGTIKGADYTGSWRVEGNQMCFTYGSDPATCYDVKLAGTTITWVKDGKEDGTGTIVKGNPNKF